MTPPTLFDSKLLTLYQALSKAELRAFKKWLRSPLHNKHKSVQQIFKFLDTRHQWTPQILQRTRLWEYMYPQHPYDDGRLRYLLSLSLDVLSEFVGYYTAQDNRLAWQNHTIQYLAQHRLSQLAKKELQKAQRLADQAYPNAQLHYHQFELEAYKFELEGTQDRTRSTNIGAIVEHASLFFMQTSLRYACIAHSHHAVKNTDYRLPLLNAVLSEIEQHPKHYQDHPLLKQYYHTYRALQGDDNHFQEMDQYRQTGVSWMQYKERRELILMGINQCIQKINKGHMDYVRRAWEWYKTGLEEALLLDDRKNLSLFAYTNIVAIGLTLGELDWVATFLETYSPQLAPEHQHRYYSYNSAKLCFARDDLDGALNHLTQTEFTDLLLLLEVKVLQLKIYYQAQYFDALDAFLDSFRIFLGRKTKVITPSRKESHRNLIRFTKQLMNLPPSAKAKAKLRKAVEQTELVRGRDWLLERL